MTIPVLLISLLCFYFAYLSPSSYISRADVSPNWVWALQYVGYTPYFVHRSMLATSVVRKPVGYEQVIDNIYQQMERETDDKNEKIINKKEYPDLIFVLNETYFDIDILLNIDCHNVVFENYDKAKGIKGYAVSPQIGGGTNCSEYEYLTGNSMHLIPYVVPFVYLDMKEANTAVSFLKSRGYSTVGMHQFDPTCYSRNVAYPAIGFEDILWKDGCQNLRYYGDRKDFATDQSVYENLIKSYENTETDFPKCIYCLTIQNHGHWEQNNDQENLINIKEDFGEYTDDINEYLSCMKLSDEALGYLFSYFESIDRDVVIVVGGDHCPAFLPNLVENAGDEQINLKLRSTPFIIWSNHLLLDQSLLSNQGLFSMNYLVPTALQLAGVPMSNYYSYLAGLREEYPILEVGNGYYDANYNYHTYKSEVELPERLKDYYYMEYLNIKDSQKAKAFYE